MADPRHRFDNSLRRRPEDHPNQTAITPAYILDPVRIALGGVINLDPCTTPDNPVGADRWYALPTDGAGEPWRADTIWCNPPYGEARTRWVDRCVEAADRGSRVVLLIPASTDTRVFQRAVTASTGLVFVRGRVKFGVPRANGRQVAASHPSVLIGWNVDLSPCAHLGVVVRVAGEPR